SHPAGLDLLVGQLEGRRGAHARAVVLGVTRSLLEQILEDARGESFHLIAKEWSPYPQESCEEEQIYPLLPRQPTHAIIQAPYDGRRDGLQLREYLFGRLAPLGRGQCVVVRARADIACGARLHFAAGAISNPEPLILRHRAQRQRIAKATQVELWDEV